MYGLPEEHVGTEVSDQDGKGGADCKGAQQTLSGKECYSKHHVVGSGEREIL